MSCPQIVFNDSFDRDETGQDDLDVLDHLDVKRHNSGTAAKIRWRSGNRKGWSWRLGSSGRQTSQQRHCGRNTYEVRKLECSNVSKNLSSANLKKVKHLTPDMPYAIYLVHSWSGVCWVRRCSESGDIPKSRHFPPFSSVPLEIGTSIGPFLVMKLVLQFNT